MLIKPPKYVKNYKEKKTWKLPPIVLQYFKGHIYA